VIAGGDLEVCSLDFISMSPPRVGASGMAGRNTRTRARVVQEGTEEVPTVVDVDEIHTPEYEPNTMRVEEEHNPEQEVGKPEDDVERTKSDMRREGKGHNRKNMPQVQCHRPENQMKSREQCTRVYQRWGPHPHREGRNLALRVACKEYHGPQAEVTLVMPKIPEGVQIDDEMVGGVNTMKYSDHDVADTIKFLDLSQQNYMESRGEGPSGAPLLEPAQWILGLYNTGIMNLLDIPHFGCGKHINDCVKKLLARVHGGISVDG
jgi:hypothetical protein